MAEKDKIIETLDEEGNKVSFELIDIVNIDEIDYALLMPVNTENNEDEILVMRLKKDGEEYLFEVIEDDNEFEKVSQYIESIEEETEE